MKPPATDSDPAPNSERQAHWRRQLGRLRLDAEPIPEQVARYQRATIALTGATVVVGSMFLGIFGAFGRVDVGLAVVGVLLVPVVLLAWLDFALLRAQARAYLEEEDASRATSNAPPGGP